jgi:Tfp pilus assembly protein PilF
MWIRVLLAIMSFATLTAITACNRVSAPKTSSNAIRINDMRDFDEAIQRNPMDAEAYAKRALAWLNQGNDDKALNDYDQAIRLQPENAVYLNNRGFTWHMKGIGNKDRPTCEERALSDYARAIRIDPTNASAINNRAWLWATSQVDKCRNGKQAVEEATSTVKVYRKS